MTQQIINPTVQSVFESIKANNGKLTIKNLKELFGEKDAHHAVSKLTIHKRIKRVRLWSSYGVTFVYKVLE